MQNGDVLIPLAAVISVASPIVLGLVIALGVLWRKLITTEEKWEREVKRSVALAAMTPTRGPATRPPPPEWDETPFTRMRRQELEREAADELLRREQAREDQDERLRSYIAGESTPPRLKR